MKKINEKELCSVFRIYNHVESIVGPYYGKKRLEDIRKYISQNRWIMFPEYHVASLREGAELPIPNVFIDTLTDDGYGKADGYIGFTYPNVPAMAELSDILRRKEKTEYFIRLLKGLPVGWSIEVQYKTKADCKESTPHYRTAWNTIPLLVTAKEISEALVNAGKTALHRGDPYPETGNPVLWDVVIFTVLKKTTYITFDTDIKTCFDLFLKLLSIR